MKKLLLLGATGIVGTDMLAIFRDTDKFEITCTSRKNYAPSKNVKWISFDAAESVEKIRNAVKESDYIILNLASKVLGNTTQEQEILQKINIDFPSGLSELIKEYGNKKIIYISSLSVLKKPVNDVITEEHECAPLLPYSISKLKAENLLLKINGINGCEVFLFRISSPVPSEVRLMDDTVLKKWILSAKNNVPLSIYGKGERTQDFISAKDIARVCINALETSETGIYHIATGKPVSMNNLAHLIKQHFPSASFSHTAADKESEEMWNISIDKAKRKLNFAPVSSEKAITELIKSVL